MRYDQRIFNELKEIRELREHCPKTCESCTGVGQGSVCRCCYVAEFSHCSWFTGSLQCPVIWPVPVPPPLQCCLKRIMIRDMQRYLANGGTLDQTVCC
jgi:hypothetical protein